MNLFATPAVQLRTDSSAQAQASGQSYIIGVHILQVGETLRQVAEHYNISPEALVAANPQIQERLTTGLVAGTQLAIPASQSVIGVAPGDRGFDVPRPASYNPAPTNGLTPPSGRGGVSVQQPYAPVPARSFYSDPTSRATPPVPITWPRPMRSLSYGNNAPDVETLQRALCRVGYALRVDGQFGGETDSAVRNFQSLYGLPITGTMDSRTWAQLRTAADAVRTPSQILVTASREQFQTYDELNAYDIMMALAYDFPGEAATSSGDGFGLRELLRVCGQPVRKPTTITPEAVTAFAYKALQMGMPLNPDSLSPLAPLRLSGSNKPTYHEARALCDFFVRVLPGRSSITNNHRWDGLIDTTARQYGVSPALVKAIMSAESSFRPGEVSSANAQGLMQVIPETAAFVGVSDPSTPEANVLAGVRYLSYLLRRFDGDLVNTIAGYNAGPTRVDNNGGVPPIQETYEYTRRVLVAYTYYLQHPPMSGAA